MHVDTEDAELKRRLRAGDESALAEVFSRYQPLLVDRAYIYLQNIYAAEDIAQDAFIRLWDYRRSLSEKVSLRAYLLKITVSICLNRLRRNNFEKAYKAQAAGGISPITQDGSIEKKEMETQIHKAIARIPTISYRKAVEMLYLQQKSIQEIAQETGTDAQVVRNQVYRALKYLRGLLKKDAF